MFSLKIWICARNIWR